VGLTASMYSEDGSNLVLRNNVGILPHTTRLHYS